MFRIDSRMFQTDSAWKQTNPSTNRSQFFLQPREMSVYILICAFITVLVLKVAEVFFHAPPLFDRAMGFINERYPRSYTSLFFTPILAVVAAYGIAILVGAPFFGVADVCEDLGTGCALTFLLFMLSFFGGFLKDVAGQAGRLVGGNGPAAREDVKGSVTFVFLFGVYGSLGLVALKTLGIE